MVEADMAKPTSEQVEELRRRLQQFIEREGGGELDPRDVDRYMKEEYYVARYFMHCEPMGGDQMEHAHNMTINTMKFRKEHGMRGKTMEAV